MKHRTSVGTSGNHELTHLGWTVAALKGLRRIATVDCASMLYEGFLKRLEHEFDEADAATYLGPASSGPQMCTVRCSVKELKATYNVRCYNED